MLNALLMLLPLTLPPRRQLDLYSRDPNHPGVYLVDEHSHCHGHRPLRVLLNVLIQRRRRLPPLCEVLHRSGLDYLGRHLLVNLLLTEYVTHLTESTIMYSINDVNRRPVSTYNYVL